MNSSIRRIALLGTGLWVFATPLHAGLKEAPNFNRAMELADAGDYQGAIEKWDLWIKTYPDDAAAIGLRGLAKLSLGDLDGAIVDYTRAIELRPDAAFVGYSQRSFARYLKRDYDGAIADASEALRIRPEFGRGYMYRGMARQGKGDLDGAIDDFSRAIAEDWKQATAFRIFAKSAEEGEAAEATRRAQEMDMEEGRAYGLRSWVRRLKGDLDGAIADASQAIELNSQDGEAYGHRATARSAKGDLDGAITDFTKALQVLPKYSIGFAYRGYAKWRKQDNEGALADYDRAISLDPRYGAFFRDRGRVKFSMGNIDGAFADYAQAVELDPRDFLARLHRGVCRREKGDLDGALVDMNQVLAAEPANTSAYRARADTHYQKKDWPAAIADFDAAARQEKPNPYGALMSCVLRIRQGETERGRKEYAAYLDGRKKNEDVWVGKLGEFLLGTLKEEDLLRAAESTNPSTTLDQTCEAWYFVGMQRLAAGQKTEAAECFRKCLATEKRMFTEYMLAAVELRWLEAK
jgi:tetratricopeptide (TPR) repeat protein